MAITVLQCCWCFLHVLCYRVYTKLVFWWSRWYRTETKRSFWFGHCLHWSFGWMTSKLRPGHKCLMRFQLPTTACWCSSSVLHEGWSQLESSVSSKINKVTVPFFSSSCMLHHVSVFNFCYSFRTYYTKKFTVKENQYILVCHHLSQWCRPIVVTPPAEKNTISEYMTVGIIHNQQNRSINGFPRASTSNSRYLFAFRSRVAWERGYFISPNVF